MKNLEINYSLPQNLKYLALASGACLFVLSVGVLIIARNNSFFFYIGLLCLLVSVVVAATFWFLNAKPLVVITDEKLQVNLPNQEFNCAVEWKNVTNIAIGLSYVTLQTAENGNFKIDLENLKYVDIRAIKTKLIEVCEEKNIAYSSG